MQRLVVTLATLATALAGTILAVPTGASAAVAEAPGVVRSAPAPARAADGRRVLSREIAFRVFNTQGGLLPCHTGPDDREVTVRARLVGPARVVRGRGGATTFNLMVHDAGTGGWFWHLRDRPAYDHATQLAKQGQTSVVLDRLGYDRSPLRDGTGTCLNAQVGMVHQIVQHLYAGQYAPTRGGRDAPRPHASHVVLHGHGTGATIARLESARYRDVQALVLVSPASTSATGTAMRALGDQTAACVTGAGFAPYGATAREYRGLLFASATPAVQGAATRLRNSTPCGDVASLVGTLLEAQARPVDVPTLVLRGAADARSSGAAVSTTGKGRVVRRTFAGAGSALPLERQAPAVRRAVLRFVRSLDDRVR
jgi:hypothetical protein